MSDGLAEAKELLAQGKSARATARILRTSVPTLRRIFLRHEGKSAFQWQIETRAKTSVRARVQRAEHLLLSGAMTISAIAQEVGFRCPHALTQAFVRIRTRSD
jgi:AraC-like DNA-binding protein